MPAFCRLRLHYFHRTARRENESLDYSALVSKLFFLKFQRLQLLIKNSFPRFGTIVQFTKERTSIYFSRPAPRAREVFRYGCRAGGRATHRPLCAAPPAPRSARTLLFTNGTCGKSPWCGSERAVRRGWNSHPRARARARARVRVPHGRRMRAYQQA